MKNRIGLDCQSKTFQTATANGNLISNNEFLKSHSCGCYVCASVPADCLFFENITIPPNAPHKKIEQYLDSLFDVKIPVPIEDCITVYFPTSPSSYVAFAVHQNELNRTITKIQSIAGCRPEFLLPAPFVLWQSAVNNLPSSPTSLRVLHIHLSDDSWTLLSCSKSSSASSIDGIVSSPANNIQTAIRNLKIMASRKPESIDQISLSGELTSITHFQTELATAFPFSKIFFLSSPTQTLAALLAQTASSSISDRLNFAKGKLEHPARINRRNSRKFALSLLPLFASIILLFTTVFHYNRASASFKKFNAYLSSIATRLAARPIPQKGASAIDIALNEFNDRIDPFIESITSPNAPSALKTIFAFAQARKFKISSFEGNFASITVSGIAPDPQVLPALTSELESLGFNINITMDQSIPGTFSISITNPNIKNEVE